jgi:phytol kinase
MADPFTGILVALCAGLGLMAALAVLRRLYAPHPELVRKLFHCGIGMIALSFPWLFGSVWPVLAISVTAFAILCGLRQHTMLRERLGGVLDGVDRRSWGDFYYLTAIPLLFWVAEGDLALYSVPILVLAVADAGAALVGIRFGRLRYGPAGLQKSVEGSVAFFVLAFISAVLSLALIADSDPTSAVAAAAVVAALTTPVEAVARRGLDNLLIPVTAYLALSMV